MGTNRPLRVSGTWLFAFVIVMTCTTAAPAGDTYWQHDPETQGSWHNDKNWTAGKPGSADTAFIDNGGTSVVSLNTEVYKFYLGDSAGSEGNCELTGGTLTVASFTSGPVIGNWGEGYFLQTGGNLACQYSMLIGYNDGGQGTFELVDGSVSVQRMVVGRGSSGTLIQRGGTITMFSTTSDDIVWIHPNGHYDLSDGSMAAQTFKLDGGRMTQSGGSFSAITSDWWGNSVSMGRGDVSISGGEFYAMGMAVGIGNDGPCTFQQSEGAVTIDRRLHIGGWVSWHGDGTYQISGGSLNCAWVTVGYYGERGVLHVIGPDAEIAFENYTQERNGELISEVTSLGISVINIEGSASLDNTWTVLDSDAGFGRFDILTAIGGISGDFDTIDLPGEDWIWGIENGDTLWVEHIPEPATLSLLAIGAVALIRRRRK